MTYKEYRLDREQKLNALPIFWAFSNKQFEAEMAKRGLTTSPEDCKKLYKIPNGGFYLKTDAKKILDYLNSDNLSELMKDKTFALEAFEYEMDNHEYALNYQGDWDVCQCFFDCKYEDSKTGEQYLRENGCDEVIIAAYKTARSRHMRKAKNW